MPGPEDYGYVHEDDTQAEFKPTLTEVSQADSNPAFYPPEAKSEALLTEDEKKELKEREKPREGDDVVNGEGETVMTAEEVKPSEPAKSESKPETPAKTVPKAKSKD